MTHIEITRTIKIAKITNAYIRAHIIPFPMQFKKSPQLIDEEQLAVLAANIVQALDSMSEYWPWLANKYKNRLTHHVYDFLKEISLDPSKIDFRRCPSLDVSCLQLVYKQSTRDLTILRHLSHTRDMYFLAIELSIKEIDSNGQRDAMEESTFKDFIKLDITDRRLYVVMLQYVKECAIRFSDILGETRRLREKGLDICAKIENLRRNNPKEHLERQDAATECYPDVGKHREAFCDYQLSEKDFLELREWADDPSIMDNPDIKQVISCVKQANQLLRRCQDVRTDYDCRLRLLQDVRSLKSPSETK
jgi:hypothetical protein